MAEFEPDLSVVDHRDGRGPQFHTGLPTPHPNHPGEHIAPEPGLRGVHGEQQVRNPYLDAIAGRAPVLDDRRSAGGQTPDSRDGANSGAAP
jgi:hypothetical protein